MFSNNHHNDGHVAVWIPAPPGEQEALIASFPSIYYRPPYVGVKGWVGIELNQIGDEELGAISAKPGSSSEPPAEGKHSPVGPRRPTRVGFTF